MHKFGKLGHLVSFTINKFVTMHGHMNVQFIPVGKNKILSTSSILKLLSFFQPFCKLQRVLFCYSIKWLDNTPMGTKHGSYVILSNQATLNRLSLFLELCERVILQYVLYRMTQIS
jgi:S-ribosylhomocysteine lyase LuxS involved in autoinducer biosynthesis